VCPFGGQQRRRRGHVRSITGRPEHSLRGRGRRRGSAAGAGAAHHPILDHHKLDRRDIEHLGGGSYLTGRVGQIPTATTAPAGLDYLDTVSGGNPLQAATGMAPLPTRSPTRGTPPLALLHARPVLRRWGRGVRRVHPQPTLQLGYLGLQHVDQLRLGVQLRRLPINQLDLPIQQLGLRGKLFGLHRQPGFLPSDDRLLPRDHLTQPGIHRPQVSHKSNIIDTPTTTIKPTRR
jgi:hypothetical protein